MQGKIVLQVNSAVDLQIHSESIYVQVNNASIRRESHNGRDHFVIPSYTLPANVVMNGGLYPSSEIDNYYQDLEGSLAPLGHPTMGGVFISASSPEGLNTNHIGAWNRNVQKRGNRVYMEKWVDIETARKHEGGARLIERLEANERGETIEPIHTSVAVFLQRVPVANSASNGEYSWVAKFSKIDHDAILLDEPGAAGPDKGVGLMVNANQAKTLAANNGVLVGESFRDRERRLEEAAKERFVVDQDRDYVWVADFNDNQAIIVRNGGDANVYGYKEEGGKIVLDQEGSSVVRRETWVSKIPVVNKAMEHLYKLFTNDQARPDKTKESDMPLTTEEKAELTKEIGANVQTMLGEALKPIVEGMATLQSNQKEMVDKLTANERAEEGVKREAVKQHFGLSDDAVAALSGNALDEMHKKCGSAAAIGPGNGGLDVNKQTGAPDPKEHFGA